MPNKCSSKLFLRDAEEKKSIIVVFKGWEEGVNQNTGALQQGLSTCTAWLCNDGEPSWFPDGSNEIQPAFSIAKKQYSPRS